MRITSFYLLTFEFCPWTSIFVSVAIRHRIIFLVFYGDLVYKLRGVKGEANLISSGSKIVKRLRRRQYDPAIIERTIGLVLNPCTALYRSFLKRCTLTIKAVGTILRAFFKPLRPFRLLVGTPWTFWPEPTYRLRVAQPTLMDVHMYFWYTILLIYMFVYRISMTCPLSLVLGLYKEDYLQFLVHLNRRLKCIIVITRCRSAVRRPSSLFVHIFDFFFETAVWNSKELDRKQDRNVLYQVCVFGPIGKIRCPTWPLIWWDIIDFFSETAQRHSKKLDRK